LKVTLTASVTGTTSVKYSQGTAFTGSYGGVTRKDYIDITITARVVDPAGNSSTSAPITLNYIPQCIPG
jgi:hypothetical protein